MYIASWAIQSWLAGMGGSMISKRISFFGILVGAAVVSGLLAGCGGSSASVQGINPTVSATGGAPSQSASSTTSVPQSTTPQQVQVTQADGSQVNAFVPAGESFTAGTPVAVLPASVPFINGLTFAPKSKISNQSTIHAVYVDGQLSGVVVNADGSLSGFVILTQGVHTVTTTGPFDLGNGNNTLTIGAFSFGVTVMADGGASIPNTITMRIPANGGSTANGNFVNVTYPTPEFANGQGSLILTWPGVTKSQTKNIVNGKVNFSDPLSDSSDIIPAGGVSTITFNWSSK